LLPSRGAIFASPCKLCAWVSQAIQAVRLKDIEFDSAPSDDAQIKKVWHRMNLCSAVHPDGQVLS
jgi:hypothetical protein